MSTSVDTERQGASERSGSERPTSQRDHHWGPRSTRSAWRESALTRINELTALASWLTDAPDSMKHKELGAALFKHLELAGAAAQKHCGIVRSITGSQYERAASNIDAAEASLLQIAPAWYVRGQMPSLMRHLERNLCSSDGRLKEVQRIVSEPNREDLTNVERGKIVGAHRAASSSAMRQSARIRSFRNVLSVTSLVLIVLAIVLAIAGFLHPERVPLCFEPESEGVITVVCPD